VTYDCHHERSFGSHYLASILRVIAGELKARGYYLLVYPMMVGEDLAPLVSLLRGGRLDGLVLRLVQDPPATDSLVELVAEADVPCVCIERPAASRFGLTAVTYDNVGGAYAATRHLSERGHRRIAHLQGDRRYATGLERLAGYEQALRDAGLPIDDRLIRGAGWEMEEAIRAIPDLMAAEDPPTAIFAASDDLALGALERLRASGYRVPEDVALVGFDGIPLSQEVIPSLTTIRVPFAELGHRAAELVLGGAHRQLGGAPEVLPVELIHAGSA
jgi:LacI family transcriptional regulator